MTENQQKGLLFILSSSKQKSITKPTLDSELTKLDKRDNCILIKNSNSVVKQVISEDEDDNYGDVIQLMRSIKNDKNKN